MAINMLCFSTKQALLGFAVELFSLILIAASAYFVSAQSEQHCFPCLVLPLSRLVLLSICYPLFDCLFISSFSYVHFNSCFSRIWNHFYCIFSACLGSLNSGCLTSPILFSHQSLPSTLATEEFLSLTSIGVLYTSE